MLRAKLAFGWPVTLLLAGLLLAATAAVAQESTGPTFTIFPGNLTVPPLVDEIGPIYANSFTVNIDTYDDSGVAGFCYKASALNPGCELMGSCEPDICPITHSLDYYTIDYTMDAGTGQTICYKAVDTLGNWRPYYGMLGGPGSYLCTDFKRGMAAPSDVSATPDGFGNVTVQFMDNSQEFPGAGYSERFYVYRQINGGSWDVANTSPIINTDFPTGWVYWSEYGVPPSACNGLVKYKVQAIMQDINSSPFSNPSYTVEVYAELGFNCPLPAPTSCTAVANINPTRANLSWQDNHSGPEGYQLWRDNNDNNFSDYVGSLDGPTDTWPRGAPVSADRKSVV